MPAQLFVRKPEAVRAACHVAWRALVDSYARQFSPLGSVRRIRLLVKPLAAELSACEPSHHRLAVTPSTLATAVASWAALVKAAGGGLHTVAAHLLLPILRPPPLVRVMPCPSYQHMKLLVCTSGALRVWSRASLALECEAGCGVNIEGYTRSFPQCWLAGGKRIESRVLVRDATPAGTL